MHRLDTTADYRDAGYANGKAGIPAPAPGFAPTTAKRAAYIEGWRAGRDDRQAK